MSLDFLTPAAAAAVEGVLARSPMERSAAREGARFEVRGGWNVAAAYGSTEQEAELCRRSVGWADLSHLGKLEVQAPPPAMLAIAASVAAGARLELGRAARVAGAWWLPLTPSRTLLVCDGADVAGLRSRLEQAARDQPSHCSVAEVTSVFAAMTILGPLAREVFARFCAVDLRPAVTPVGALRPGSIARQPGVIVREDEDRFLFLFGWAVGEYMWTVVADAARYLGGGPVGLDAVPAIAEPMPEGGHA